MKRFLTPGGVFLDIGANFGLYSMVASEIVGGKGRVYSFEANPHTYQYLRQSAMANRLIWLPNYHWENLAVADQDGELEFTYDPQQLGGGHIRHPGESDENQTVVRVRSVTLDNYLPHDVLPDFVKVDVEGHELSVLRGMEDTIRRSPNIRLMLEYYTYTDEITDYGRNVVEYIRQLGLGICAVQPGGTLRIVPDGEIPTGNMYLLVTRTPEADADHPVSAMTIEPKGLHYQPAYGEGEHTVLQSDGTLRYRREDHHATDETCLFHGPYIEIPAGDYVLSLHGDGKGSADLAVTANFGHRTFVSKRLSRWNDKISFSVPERSRAFEIVLRKRDDLERLDLNKIILEKVR